MNIAEYYNSLSKKNKKAWDRIFQIKHVEPIETVAKYIERTGAKTETRTSKRGVSLTKVYFENGIVKEYQTEHIATQRIPLF